MLLFLLLLLVSVRLEIPFALHVFSTSTNALVVQDLVDFID
jgi:hypothetical protein